MRTTSSSIASATVANVTTALGIHRSIPAWTIDPNSAGEAADVAVISSVAFFSTSNGRTAPQAIAHPSFVGSRGARYVEIRSDAGGSMFASTTTT